MKIVVSANNPHSYSAPNIWLLRILPRLKKMGVDAHVLFFSHDGQFGPVAKTLQEQGIICHPVKFSSTEANIIDVLTWLNEIQPNVFVSNVNVASCFSIPWVKAAGIKTVGILRSDDVFHHDMIAEFIMGSARYRMDGVVCNSDYLYKYVSDHVGALVQSMACPSGTPVPAIQAPAYNKGEAFKLAFAGRFVEEQKCISQTVQAFIGAAQRFSNVEFDLYGTGGLWEKMKALVEQSGFAGRIRLHGQISHEQIQGALVQSHAFVLLSEYEGLSTALCEAMACGLVPIVKDMRSGITEIVQDRATGMVVSDRTEAFYAAIEFLLNNTDAYQRLSRNAKQIIVDQYSSEVCAQKWHAFLSELLSEKNTIKPIDVPAKTQLDLPVPRLNPVGIAREDHREIDVWASVEAAKQKAMEQESHPFLNPSSGINNIDRFWVRKSILESIKATIPLLKGRFLDVGCGVMPYRELIAAENTAVTEYLGMDIETEIYKASVDLRWNGQQIPLEDDSVDSAMATEVLEHCPQPLIVLKEIRRVLKPGGAFFLTVPYIWPLHDAPWDFYRYTSFAAVTVGATAYRIIPIAKNESTDSIQRVPFGTRFFV